MRLRVTDCRNKGEARSEGRCKNGQSLYQFSDQKFPSHHKDGIAWVQ